MPIPDEDDGTTRYARAQEAAQQAARAAEKQDDQEGGNKGGKGGGKGKGYRVVQSPFEGTQRTARLSNPKETDAFGRIFRRTKPPRAGESRKRW